MAAVEVITEPMPPVLHGPTDKEKKYDRQLRLWAANGQAALENAHILLVNSGAGAVGVETLKNLILPGIGKFTICDDAIVNEADLGVNFFLHSVCLGKLRSECTAELLQELNPDVQGSHIKAADLLQKNEQYTFILYTHPIDSSSLSSLKDYARRFQTPLISINCAGFYSYFQIHLPGTFPIVDTHPDSTATTDLRLLSPWPELSSFALELTQNITALDAHTHGHIPYVALLLHFLEQWGDEHDGNSPTAYTDKVAFRKTVAAAARTDNPEGGEENFEEAVAAVLKTIIAPSLSSSVREVFDYTPTEEEAKSPFWIITSAIKKFYEAHGELPLPGAMPDMKAQSQVYVQLQNIYKTKAREDAAEVKRYVDAHPHGSGVDPQEIETYCKNAAFVKLVRATTEVNLKAIAEAELNQEFAIAPTLVPVYLALRASENIAELNQENLVQEMSRIIGAEVTDERLIHTAKEVVRAQKGELHNIAALTGGMVAQEIIKIITKQYIPVDNTCIFDGITSRCQVLKL